MSRAVAPYVTIARLSALAAYRAGVAGDGTNTPILTTRIFGLLKKNQPRKRGE
jgi:hypothetical protein